MIRLLLICLITFTLTLPCCAQEDFLLKKAQKAERLADEGRYEEADNEYREALTIVSPGSANELMLRINRCALYLRRGMYQTANDMLDAIPRNHPQYDDAWCRCKASALIYLGRYSEAIEIYEGLMESYNEKIEKGWGTDSDNDMLRESVGSKGYVLAMTQQNDSALTYMRAAIDLVKQQKDTPGRRRYLNLMKANLSLVEMRMGHAEDALTYIEDALAYFKRNGGTNHPEYIITLRKKAEILMMMNQITQATDIFIDYVEREREQAVREFALFTEQKRLDYWKNKRPLISEIFQTEGECPEALFDVSVFRREVSLLGGADSVDIPRRLSLRGRDVRKSLKAGEVVVDFIKYCSKDSIDRYAALVAYPLNDPRGVKFVPLWTETQLNGYRVGHTTLKDAVCSRLGSDKNNVYNDSTLTGMIWEPLKVYINGAVDVYFCPDGLLNMLAIEYLPLKGTKPEFHRLTSPSRITSRGETSRTERRMLAVGGLDYNEDVKEGGQGNHDAIDLLHQKVGLGSIFSYLSGTKDEVAAIDSCVKQKMPIDTAHVKSEAELKEELADKAYSAVHLSTHGYSLSVDVTEQAEMFRDSLTEDRSLIASGIALSGANVAYRNADGEDGVLSARELCDMNLKHIDLIVLSACQTALGIVSDEGPAGLVRGLKKSGANTLLATLWEVDDQATRLLMTAFYKNLAANPEMTKAEALTLAQDSLKNNRVVAVSVFNPATLASSVEYEKYKGKGDPITPYAEPYYWAPFIVIDDYIKK